MSWLGGLFGGLGSLVGAGINSATQSQVNKENIEMQKEFAQNGIQWKVQDAQKAGIHPAVALGAQTYQATPSSVGGDMGSGVSNAFKHFGSAIDSFIDDKEEERSLQLEALKLANEKERLEIAKMKTPSSLNPSSYVPSVGVEGVPNNDKLLFGQKKVSDDFNLTRTKDGTVVFTPSDDVSDYVSDSFVGSASWHKRNWSPDLDNNIYSDVFNRLVQLKQLDPLKEGLIHSWDPIEGNSYKIVPKTSKEWKDYVKFEKFSPLGLMKKGYRYFSK